MSRYSNSNSPAISFMSIDRKAVISLWLLITFTFGALVPTFGQDLVPVSSIGGGSSVFVFRGAVAGAARRTNQGPRGVRGKAQRAETFKRIKNQYEALSKAEPRRPRSPVVAPD